MVGETQYTTQSITPDLGDVTSIGRRRTYVRSGNDLERKK